MKIDHIALYVNDIETMKEFFETYFHAESGEEYYNQNTNFKSVFLSFEEGARLELMNRPFMDDLKKTENRTGYIHLAIGVGSKEKVDKITERLKKDGFEVVSGPRTTGDGYYESCIIGIEGNQIEITV